MLCAVDRGILRSLLPDTKSSALRALCPPLGDPLDIGLGCPYALDFSINCIQMTPSLSIATDNIYKFTCLFGLALIFSSILAFVSTYTASLDRSTKYSEAIISLEAKEQRSKAEEVLLTWNKKRNETTKLNQDLIGNVILPFLIVGIVFSFAGGMMWYPKQKRDDRLEILQLEKLEIEMEILRSECKRSKIAESTTHDTSESQS